MIVVYFFTTLHFASSAAARSARPLRRHNLVESFPLSLYRQLDSVKGSTSLTEAEFELDIDSRAETQDKIESQIFLAINNDSGTKISIEILPQGELDALSDFFWAQNGPNWINNMGWNTLSSANPSSPCGDENNSDSSSWFGVSCNSSHVTSIIMESNNVTGTFAASFFSLSKLTTIDLNYNNVEGVLDSFCEFTFLEKISLGYNRFFGPTPECFGSISRLESLILDFNFITGSIPSTLCELSELEQLRVRGNILTGPIPTCIGSLTSLQILDLSSIALDGSAPGLQNLSGTIPSSICAISTLQFILLQYTQGLYGTIPECLGNLRLLASLDVQGNSLSGSVPSSLCSIGGSLKRLYLFENKLTGTVPNCLGSLSNLVSFALSDNSLSGTFPSSLCTLKYNAYILLYQNILSGTIPSCIAESSSLQYLEIDDNRFVGTIPESLGNLGSSLLTLLLSSNSLHSTIPNCFNGLQNLERLELSHNSLHGLIPPSLCELEHLNHIDLSDNLFSGAIDPCFVSDLRKLEFLFLYDNDFSGKLPTFWNLSSLQALVLSNNRKISGIIPESLFDSQQLRSVVIEGTMIAGQISESICRLKYLNTIALSGNMISGPLPACISQFQDLRTLQLANNFFHGHIRPLIKNGSSLSILDLSTNSFSGQVPTELGEISGQLVKTDLTMNHLSCQLPPQVQNWKRSEFFERLDILEGNLFSCKGIFSMSMRRENGLYKANKSATNSYNCGYSGWVVPVAVILLFLVPFLLCGFNGLYRELFHASIVLRTRRNARQSSPGVSVVRILGASCVGICLVGMFMVLPLVLVVSQSSYECEFGARPSIAYKQSANANFAIGMGFSIALSLIIGLFVIWGQDNSTTSDAQTDSPSPDSELESNRDSLSSNNCGEFWQSDIPPGDDLDRPIRNATNYRGSTGEKLPERKCDKVPLLAFCSCLITFATIGPNLAYVVIVLSRQLPFAAREASVVAITVAKLLLGTIVVPWVAREVIQVVVPIGTTASLSWRLCFSMSLSSLTSIFAPMVIVLLTDSSCGYYYWHQKAPVINDVSYDYCDDRDATTGNCLHQATDFVRSTYHTKFQYSGVRCTASFLKMYAPVYLAVVILSAVAPATIDLFIVPSIASWSWRHQEHFIGQVAVSLIRSGPLHVATLVRVGDHSAASTFHLDVIMERVFHRALAQLASLLLVAMTIGIAAPVVGGACALAAIIQVLHHVAMLKRVQEIGQAFVPPVDVKLGEISTFPSLCGAVLTVTVVVFWTVMSIGVIDLKVIGTSFAATMSCFAVGGCYARRRSAIKSRLKPRGSLILKPLLDEK